MDRRTFLELTGLGLGALATGCGVDGRRTDLADPGEGLARRLPVSLLSGSRAERELELSVISGRLPTDLYGHVYIASPLPFGDGSHVFNGEGMVYRIDLGSAAPRITSRLMKTPCFYADEATRGTSMGFNNVAMARMSGTLGFRSMPNTSVVPFGRDDRLLVCVDAARPYEIDPLSMELVTPMGRLDEWRNGLPPGLFGGPFQPLFTTAHPFHDSHTDETFAVNYSVPLEGAESFLRLVRWDGESDLEAFELHTPEGQPVRILQSAHQLAVTRDHVLVMDTAFLAEGEQIVMPQSGRSQMAECVLWMVRRADLVRGGGTVEARRVVIEREAAHVVADYDDAGGRITLHMAHLTATDLSEWLRDGDVLARSGEPVRAELRGLFSTGTDRNVIGKHVIDAASATVTSSQWLDDDELTWATLYYMHRDAMPADRFDTLYYASFGFHEELYTQRIASLYEGYSHRMVPTSALPFEGRQGNLFRFDVNEMRIVDAFKMPWGRVLSSPQFVPRMGGVGGPTDGYLVATVVSDDSSWPGSSGDELWVFDAANLAQGPLCRLGAPELDFAFTIHTTWIAEARARTATYRVSAREDYGPRMEGQSEQVRALFEESVFPHFEEG